MRDYAHPDAYFVTIKTYGTIPLFGHIVDGGMVLNDHGRVVEEEWLRTGEIRPYVQLDAHVVMPDHFHGIIILQDYDERIPGIERFSKPNPRSLPSIVRLFKASAARRINVARITPAEHVWQSGYYLRIVKDDPALYATRRYIERNPENWGNRPGPNPVP